MRFFKSSPNCSPAFLKLTAAILVTSVPAFSADFYVRTNPGDTYISISGVIEEGDAEEFRTLMHEIIATPFIDGITVILDSPGGDVREAVAIGGIVRGALADTHTATTWVKLPQHSIGGNPKITIIDADYEASLPELSKCWSACTIILFSGVNVGILDNLDMRGEETQRYPTVGVHRPRMLDDQFASLTPQDAQDAYDDILSVMSEALAEMGAPDSFIRRTMATPPTEIDLIASDEMYSLYTPSETFLNDWLVARCGHKTDILTSDQREIWESYQTFLDGYHDEWEALTQSGSWAEISEFYEEDVALVQHFGLTFAGEIRRLERELDAFGRTVEFCKEVNIRTARQEWVDRN